VASWVLLAARHIAAAMLRISTLLASAIKIQISDYNRNVSERCHAVEKRLPPMYQRCEPNQRAWL
jgi:hypothetical protein